MCFRSPGVEVSLTLLLEASKHVVAMRVLFGLQLLDFGATQRLVGVTSILTPSEGTALSKLRCADVHRTAKKPLSRSETALFGSCSKRGSCAAVELPFRRFAADALAVMWGCFRAWP